jgi:hypothetical protein
MKLNENLMSDIKALELKEKEHRDLERSNYELRDRELRDREQRLREQREREIWDKEQRIREQKDRELPTREQQCRELNIRGKRDREQRNRQELDRVQCDGKQSNVKQCDPDQSTLEQCVRRENLKSTHEASESYPIPPILTNPELKNLKLNPDNFQFIKPSILNKILTHLVQIIDDEWTPSVPNHKEIGDVIFRIAGKLPTPHFSVLSNFLKRFVDAYFNKIPL